jgi:RNA polymerase sigma factor (sigma-70 family)
MHVYGRTPKKASQEDLVRSHMQLVRKIAWHVHGRVSSAIDVEDLIQIGMIALVEAANGYEDRGHAFSTYASMRVRGAMIDHLRRHAALSRSAMVKRREMLKAKSDFEKTYGRSPSESELAQAMGLDGASLRVLIDETAATYHETIDEVYSDQRAGGTGRRPGGAYRFAARARGTRPATLFRRGDEPRGNRPDARHRRGTCLPDQKGRARQAANLVEGLALTVKAARLAPLPRFLPARRVRHCPSCPR